MRQAMYKQLVQFMAFFLNVQLALMTLECKDNQYTEISPNGTAIRCIDCPKCPEGLGSSVECGTRIRVGEVIECKICVAGVNFSPSNDYEQCQSCGVCSEDQVSTPCTTQKDIKCERKCLSKKNYFEESSDDCKPCSWCCGDTDDIVIDECVQKGMPKHKSCTVHRKKKCTPPHRTVRRTTAVQTTTTGKPQTVKDKHKIHTKNVLTELMARKSKNFNNPKKSSTSQWQQVFIGVSCGLGLLFVASSIGLIVVYYKKCSSRSSDKKPSQSVIYEIQPDVKESNIKLFDLLEKNYELKEKMCDKLDLQESFAKIAHYYGMDEDKIKKLRVLGPGHVGPGPTSDVLDFIKGKNPGLLVRDFAKCLEEKERNDVLCLITKKLKTAKEVKINVD